MANYMEMVVRNYVLAAFLLLFGFSTGEEMLLNINMKKPIAVVSEKFLSITLDPAILFNSNLLSDIEKSTNMAKALSPAYIRIAGPQSNSYVFERELYPEATQADNGFTFTETHWESINEWAEKAGLDIIASLAPQHAQGAKSSYWDSRNALNLISYSDQMSYNISWQLGYECQTRCAVSGADLGRDVQRLRYMLDAFPRFAENGILAGPDVVGFKTKQQQQFLQDYFNSAVTSLNVITWHPDFAGISLEEDGVSMHYDNLALEKENLYKVIGRQISKKPLWIAESKPEECKNQFLGALVWARRLGNSAKLGVQVLMRQPDDSHFFTPTPDFWVSKLHKMLVGREVLDTKIAAGNRTHVHFYCQCTKPSEKYEKGSLTIFGINLTPSKVTANLKGLKLKTIHKYILLPGYDAPNRMFSETVLLNEKLLSLENEKEVPVLRPVIYSAEKGVKLKLPSGGIGFWVLPGLKIKTCMGNEEEVTDKSLLKKINKRLEDLEVEDELAPEEEGNNSRESLDDVDSTEDKVKSTLRQQLQRRLQQRRSVRQKDIERDDERGFRKIDGVRRDFARKRDTQLKKSISENSEEIASSEETVSKKATKPLDSAEKIRAKINKYKKQLVEHENRKKDREFFKVAKDRLKDTQDYSAKKKMDTGKVIEALTLITNVENSMKGLEKDNSTDKTILSPNDSVDITSSLQKRTTNYNKPGDDGLLDEILNTEKSKRTSVPTQIEDQIKALYRLLSEEKEKKDSQTSQRPRREITKRYTDDPLDAIHDSPFLYKRSKTEEAKERRMKRRQRIRERLEELRREKEEAKKDAKESIENNFYGFEYQSPLKNFPQGDLYLRTSSDSSRKVLENEKIGKRSDNAKKEQKDWWMEEVSANNMSNLLHGNTKSQKVKSKNSSRRYEELWEAEALKKEDENHNDQATEYPTIEIVTERQISESEDRKAKEQVVQHLINYYEQVPQAQIFDFEEFKKLQEQQPSYHSSSNPTNYQQTSITPTVQSLYASNYEHAQAAEKDPTYYSTSSNDYYTNPSSYPQTENAAYQRSKRNTKNLEALLHQEMIDQDDNNLRDCQCRVIRNAQRCQDCHLQQAIQVPQAQMYPPSHLIQTPPDYRLDDYQPNMRFRRQVEKTEDDDENEDTESAEYEDTTLDEESVAEQVPVDSAVLSKSFEIEIVPEMVPITAERLLPETLHAAKNEPTVPIGIKDIPEKVHVVADVPILIDENPPIEITVENIGLFGPNAVTEQELSPEGQIEEIDDATTIEVNLEGTQESVQPSPIPIEDHLKLESDINEQMQSRLRRKTDTRPFFRTKPTTTQRPTKPPRISSANKLTATPSAIAKSTSQHIANPRSDVNSTTESANEDFTSKAAFATTNQNQSPYSSTTAADSNIKSAVETTFAKTITDSKASFSNFEANTPITEVTNTQSVVNPTESKNSISSTSIADTTATAKISLTETVTNSISNINSDEKPAISSIDKREEKHNEKDAASTTKPIITSSDIKNKQDSTTKTSIILPVKINNTAKLEESVKLRQARLTTRAEALAALRKENESRRAKKMIEMSMKVLEDETARFAEYQRRRREQLERLKDKLRTKREKILEQYRDELIEAINESSDLKERNLKRRDLLDEEQYAGEEPPINMYSSYEPIDVTPYQRHVRDQEEYIEGENSEEYELRNTKKRSMPSNQQFDPEEMYEISSEGAYQTINTKRSPYILIQQDNDGQTEGDSDEYYTEEQQKELEQLVEEQKRLFKIKKQQLMEHQKPIQEKRELEKQYQQQLEEYYKQYGYFSQPQSATYQYPVYYDQQQQPAINYYNQQASSVSPQHSLPNTYQETPINTLQPPATYYQQSPSKSDQPSAVNYQQSVPNTQQASATHYQTFIPNIHQSHKNDYQSSSTNYQQTLPSAYEQSSANNRQPSAATYQHQPADKQPALLSAYPHSSPDVNQQSHSNYQQPPVVINQQSAPSNYQQSSSTKLQSQPINYQQTPLIGSQQPSSRTLQEAKSLNKHPIPATYEQSASSSHQQVQSAYQQPASNTHQQTLSSNQQTPPAAYYLQSKVNVQQQQQQQPKAADISQASYPQHQLSNPYYQQSATPQQTYDRRSYNQQPSNLQQSVSQPQNVQYQVNMTQQGRNIQQSDPQNFKQETANNKQKLNIKFSDQQLKNVKQPTNPNQQPLSNVDVDFYNQLLYDANKANMQQVQNLNYEDRQINAESPHRKLEKKSWEPDYRKTKRSNLKMVEIDPYIYDDEDSDYNLHNLYMRPSSRSLIRNYRHEPDNDYFARYKRDTNLEKKDEPLLFSLGLEDNKMKKEVKNPAAPMGILRRKREAEVSSSSLSLQRRSPINKNIKKAYREDFADKYKKYPKTPRFSWQESSRIEKRSIDETNLSDFNDNKIMHYDDSEMKEIWSNLIDLKEDEQLLKEFDRKKMQMSKDRNENQRNLDRYLQSKTNSPNALTNPKTTTQTNIQSMIVDAIPKLQTVITNGLKKAENVSGNLENFLDDFNEGVNETSEKNAVEEVNDNINGTISHGVFKSVVGGVKKVFGFVFNLAKILY